MRAFADALDSVPMALAENSGLSPIETLAAIKSRHVKEKNSRLGIDCMQTGSNGMLFYYVLLFYRHTMGKLVCLISLMLVKIYRYARPPSNRPVNLKATAATTGDAAMSDGSKGKCSFAHAFTVNNHGIMFTSLLLIENCKLYVKHWLT